MSGPASHYDILQVSPWASPEVVEAAYLVLMARWQGTPAGDAVSLAGRVLLDPESRCRYDAETGLAAAPDTFGAIFDLALLPGIPVERRRVGTLDGRPLYRLDGTQHHVLENGEPVSPARLADAARRGRLRSGGTALAACPSCGQPMEESHSCSVGNRDDGDKDRARRCR